MFSPLPWIVLTETGVILALVFLLYRKTKKTKGLLTDREEAKSTIEEQTKAAEDSRNRTLSILESMAEGVMVIDTRQRIVVLNSALARLFGFKKEEAYGRYYWEVFRDRGINEMFEACLQEKTAVKREHGLLLTDLVFEIQVSPVLAQEKFLGAVAVFHDVTPIKKLERMKTEFVANVSHELKTPLTSILGFIETLKEGALEDPKNRMKFLQIIEDHSQKLYRLIEDLLVLSELESQKSGLKKESVDLEKMLVKMSEIFQRAMQAKEISFSYEVSPRPFLLTVDAKSFDQVFSNLLDNAVKYNEPGGRIHVKATRDPHEAKIEVSDTGIGIPKEDAARIFERFYRAEKSRSRETGGTGLGLSIVKHIVDRHAGRIEVSANMPKGSIFRIILPPQ
ncbi:MAG: PAS domain S-box protein [Candidatus Omnitrophica bacterium]|nr:PAS domain S-box protein [Candidatus Omnitrophota bacterium]